MSQRNRCPINYVNGRTEFRKKTTVSLCHHFVEFLIKIQTQVPKPLGKKQNPARPKIIKTKLAILDLMKL